MQNDVEEVREQMSRALVGQTGLVDGLLRWSGTPAGGE